MPRLVDSLAQTLRQITLAVAVALAATVTACSPPDGLTREDVPGGPVGLQAANIGDPDLAALVEQDLTCLYSKAGLLPNESSSLGKFRTIVSSVLAGDLAGAQTEAEKLIKFIELKYSQYNNPNGTVDCGPPLGEVPVTELKERVVARINAYVTLGGNVCEIPVTDNGSPATFCRTADNQTALVYFPEDIFSQLTYVSIEENPAGFNSLQDLGFDEYPTYVRVVTEPISDFRGFDVKPLVVVCFNEQVVPQNEALRERLLLGHRKTSASGIVSFSLMPTPEYGEYPSDVLTTVDDFCGTAPSSSVTSGPFSPSNLFGRIGNRVANLFAPAPLQASMALAFRGVGGSAEEFSEFGAVDRGLTGRGGVGGSAEEFLRAELKAGAIASATVSAAGDTVTGKVGVDTEVTDPAELPRVRVVSPAGENPIAGVSVTFSVTTVGSHPASAAGLCGSASAVTDANGYASPACLNFGNTVGFARLVATFDPTTVDAEACILGGTGLCATSEATRNFTLATVAGDPAKLGVTNAPGSTSAQAGVAMVPQPVLQVQDAAGNPVTELSADVPVTVSVTKADGTPGGSVAGGTASTNKATGQVTLSGLGLGGTVGTTYKLTFASGALTSATANVTVSAAGAAAQLAVVPAATSAAAGGLISPIVATVRDAYGNGVAGVAVAISGTDLTCFSAATDCLTATTNASGQASFGDLTVEGAGTSRTLTVASDGLTSQNVALTLTAGAATTITPIQPIEGLYLGARPIGVNIDPSPVAKVTDAYGNAVPGATVFWQLQSQTNGASVSASSTSTSAAGTTSVAWRLGDGDNGLKAYLGSLESNNFAAFTAISATGGVSLSCEPGNRTRKIDIGGYDAGQGAYVGNFSMSPELAGRFRTLRLYMSVTGQSSGTGDYAAVVKVYRGSKSPANLLATGAPSNANGIQLDGNNGNPAPIDFTLTPVASASVGGSGNANLIIIEVTVFSPATRTLQVWYNSPSGGGTCANAIRYAPGVTNFAAAASRDITRGLLIRVTN